MKSTRRILDDVVRTEIGRRKSLSRVLVPLLLMCTSCHQPSGAFSFSPHSATNRYDTESFVKFQSGTRPKRCRHVSAIHSTASESRASSPKHPNTKARINWKVGNVYDDLDQLQREISISQADQHLRQVEDRERLDTFAAQRRPIQRDVRRFILAPLALSLLLTLMSKSPQTQAMARSFIFLFNVQFWFVVVAAPIILLLAKQRSLPPSPPLPTELKGLDPDYYRFIVTDWEDPKKSCRDHVLCLLENWTSAVAGPALFGCLYCLLPRTAYASTGLAAAQLITRLGMLAALYQYPMLLYQLRRHRQPRPMDRYTVRLQELTWLALTLAPLGIASDLSKIMARIPPRLLTSMGGFAMAIFLKYQIRRGSHARPLTRKSSFYQSLLKIGLSVVQLGALWNVGGVLRGLRSWKPSFSYFALAATGISFALLVG